MGTTEVASAATEVFQKWSGVAEVRMLAYAGLDMRAFEPKGLENLIGRGRMPRMIQEPAFEKRKPVEELAWLMGVKKAKSTTPTRPFGK